MTATLALADRLARLERAVASLQQQQPGSEALQPTYTTITPAGLVGALFPGGVQIPPAQDTAYPPGEANAVSWIRSSDGALIASIDSSYGGPNGTRDGQLRLTVRPGGPGASGNDATVALQAFDNAGNQVIELAVGSINDGYGSGNPSADDHVTIRQRFGNSLFIYRASDGASSWLQLLSAQKLQLAGGIVPVPFPGASSTSSAMTIAHGLGGAPQFFSLTPLGTFTPATDEPVAWMNTLDATNLHPLVQLAGGTKPPAGNYGSLAWIAIG